MRRAPVASPLAGIYLHALHELDQRPSTLAKPSLSTVRVQLGVVAQSLGQVPDGDDQLPALRHLLAHYLGGVGLHDAALEQFRLIGPWCGALPWTDGSNVVRAFDRARAVAARHGKSPRAEAN